VRGLTLSGAKSGVPGSVLEQLLLLHVMFAWYQFAVCLCHWSVRYVGCCLWRGSCIFLYFSVIFKGVVVLDVEV